jgi:hypothetical protein
MIGDLASMNLECLIVIAAAQLARTAACISCRERQAEK